MLAPAVLEVVKAVRTVWINCVSEDFGDLKNNINEQTRQILRHRQTDGCQRGKELGVG